MSLQEIAVLSEIVNAIAVTLTLIVLIVSIRQNTQSQKVVAVESLAAAITSINIPAMESPALGAALMNVMRDWDAASRDERIIAHYFLFCYFKLGEQAWYQYKAKVLDAGQWSGWERAVRAYYHSPGIQRVWWPNRRNAYSPDFQAYLAQTMPPSDIGALSDIFERTPA
jgi:hypothetical protein